MKYLNKKSLLSVAIVSVLGTSLASAEASPTPMPNVYDGGNRWSITAYNDASPSHRRLATQSICFKPYVVKGTHIRGKWYSDTFPDWNGVYSQEGDQVSLHGDYADNTGHDGVIFDIVTNDRENYSAGHWTEWRENPKFGKTVVFANASLQRIGKCKNHQNGHDDPAFFALPPRLLMKGGEAVDPMQEDQEPLDKIPQLDSGF